jgi:serine protease Do
MTFTFNNAVVGAVMVPLSEGLGRLTGVQSGVFITNAPASSPAAESGLRDGDVIVKVDGQPVRSVRDVRELVGRAGENGERSVKVEYVRERRTRTTTLRW